MVSVLNIKSLLYRKVHIGIFHFCDEKTNGKMSKACLDFSMYALKLSFVKIVLLYMKKSNLW